jgi:hypothetical protein
MRAMSFTGRGTRLPPVRMNNRLIAPDRTAPMSRSGAPAASRLADHSANARHRRGEPPGPNRFNWESAATDRNSGGLT